MHRGFSSSEKGWQDTGEVKRMITHYVFWAVLLVCIKTHSRRVQKDDNSLCFLSSATSVHKDTLRTSARRTALGTRTIFVIGSFGSYERNSAYLHSTISAMQPLEREVLPSLHKGLLAFILVRFIFWEWRKRWDSKQTTENEWQCRLQSKVATLEQSWWIVPKTIPTMTNSSTWWGVPTIKKIHANIRVPSNVNNGQDWLVMVKMLPTLHQLIPILKYRRKK